MKIAIIGLGYVGLPLGLQFAKNNIPVVGLDTDSTKVSKINSGQSYIGHISASQIKKVRNLNLLEASTDFSRVKEVDAVIICVPTPLGKNYEPDISFVLMSGSAIAPHIATSEDTKKKKIIVLESTTFPGTTDTDLRMVLERESGLRAGIDFHLAFSPEREDPGRKDHSVKTIPKLMGGYTEKCLERCMELYSLALDHIHPVKSCKIAEATKLTENIFRSVNIALVNELKIIFHKMDIDVWDVIDAAATKPFGYMPFYPGPGLGGHCIPIDPFYLTWKAKEYNQYTKFIELAGEINTFMPEYVVARVVDVLNENSKSVKGSKILLLGLAYKPNVDDDRESPSYVLMEKLETKGAIVDYNDPHIPKINLTREHPEFAGRESTKISDSYDCILVATQHDEYRTFNFSTYTTPVVDTRNCISKKPEKYYKA